MFKPNPTPTQEKFLLDINIFVDKNNDGNIMEESKNTAKNKIKGIRDNQKRSNKEKSELVVRSKETGCYF